MRSGLPWTWSLKEGRGNFCALHYIHLEDYRVLPDGVIFRSNTTLKAVLGSLQCQSLTLVWKHECSAVRNGCLADNARIRFSVMVHSTSSSWIITSFFSTLMAYTSSVPFLSASITCHNHKSLRYYFMAVPATKTIPFVFPSGLYQVRVTCTVDLHSLVMLKYSEWQRATYYIPLLLEILEY